MKGFLSLVVCILAPVRKKNFSEYLIEFKAPLALIMKAIRHVRQLGSSYVRLTTSCSYSIIDILVTSDSGYCCQAWQIRQFLIAR